MQLQHIVLLWLQLYCCSVGCLRIGVGVLKITIKLHVFEITTPAMIDCNVIDLARDIGM